MFAFEALSLAMHPEESMYRSWLFIILLALSPMTVFAQEQAVKATNAQDDEHRSDDHTSNG